MTPPDTFRPMRTDTDGLLRRAREAFERRDYLAALADAREVIAKHPDFADVRHLMGLCLASLGESEGALEQFDQALALNPRYIDAHLSRAITLNELGRFDEARESLDRAAESEADSGTGFPVTVAARLANAHAGVAELYMAAGAPAEAVVELGRALDLRPGYHDLRNRLGEALLQLGQLDAARVELERALDGNAGFQRARMNLGLVHYRAGRLDQAREEWEEVRRHNPDGPQVRAYLHLLQRT
jgi:tetratricopeptide (TPR) repeat protein